MAEIVNTDLELRETNLYAAGRLITFPDGTQVLEREFIDYEPTEDDVYHTVKQGDELDEIAFDRYQEVIDPPLASKLWWVLADANVIENPLDISNLVGVDIVIPNITRFLLING